MPAFFNIQPDVIATAIVIGGIHSAAFAYVAVKVLEARFTQFEKHMMHILADLDQDVRRAHSRLDREGRSHGN